MKVIIGIGTAVIVVGLIAFIIFLIKVKGNNDEEEAEKYSDELLELMDKTKTYDKLLEIQYSNSGDSNGNINQITLFVNDKKLRTEFKNYHNEPLQVVEYTVSDEDIALLLSEIEEYNFPEWKDLKEDNSEFALDAPSQSIIFIYDNTSKRGNARAYYGLNYYMNMPEDGREALTEFANLVKGLAKSQNKIKEYEEQEEPKVEEPVIINSFDTSNINQQ